MPRPQVARKSAFSVQLRVGHARPLQYKAPPPQPHSLRGWCFYHTNYFTKLNGRSLWNATVQCSLAEAYKPSTSSNVRVASAALDGDTITVSADAYARGVELETDADCVLSDNYFDMNAGQRQIKVLEGKPDSVKVRSVFDIR